MLPLTECCGCTACAAACPKQCITMTADREGFLRPQILEADCIHCGKCEQRCPVLKERMIPESLPAAFAARNVNLEERISSSSGGLFSLLASAVLDQGGIVYGAAMDDSLQVVHIGVETAEMLPRLRGSKYVSSRLGDTFLQIRQQLQTGRQVLFSGTPCQVEGLLSFLGRPFENLLTVDFICHGVPSAKVWQTYLDNQKKQHASDVRAVSFRCKDTGWKNYSMKLSFQNGSEYKESMRNDPFLHAFLDNLCLRPACHQCHFKTIRHNSDLTMADFWGVQDLMPTEDDDKGTSLVFVHSEKGQLLMDQLQTSLLLKPVDPKLAASRNSAMVRSVTAHHFRQYFFHRLGKTPFDRLVYSCFQPSLPVRLHRMAIMKLSNLLHRTK